MSNFGLRFWAEMQTRKTLVALAPGMPYLHESKKGEIINWLLEYTPAKIEAAMKVDA